MPSKLVVHLAPAGQNDSFVELDGQRVKGCYGITIEGKVGTPTSATLLLRNIDVTFDTEVEDDDIARLVESTELGDATKKYRAS